MNEKIAGLIGDNAFELDLYEAAARNLTDEENKLRFNNFAYAMRELSRHILHRLAPDSEVLQCGWYKNVTNRTDGISRVQRAIYATQGGLLDDYVRNTLHLDPTAAHKALQTAIDGLSRYTHIELDVFDLAPEEVERLAQETTEAIAGLADAINACRNNVIDGLEDAIHEGAIQEIVGDSLPSVDELATHFSLEDVYVDSSVITDITHDTIHFLVTGSISVVLQWGSNSDLRNGDGAELAQDFNFTCLLTCPTAAPEPGELEFVEDSVMVDTGAWRDDSRDEEWDDIDLSKSNLPTSDDL
ncbi:pPIWI-associating nuclease domain-containing protein [Pseudomonas sp. S2_H08]